MASRIPYDLAEEKQDSAIQESQKPDGKSMREAAIEEAYFRQENRHILILSTVFMFFFMAIAPSVGAWTGNDTWGVLTCVVGVGCVWVLTYYSYLRWKYKKGL